MKIIIMPLGDLRRLQCCYQDGQLIADVYVDGAIQFNSKELIYPAEVEKVLNVAKNFSLFYDNLLIERDFNLKKYT